MVGAKQGGPSCVQIALSHAEPMPIAWELYETTRNVDCLKVDTLLVKDGLASFDLPDEAIFTLASVEAKEK